MSSERLTRFCCNAGYEMRQYITIYAVGMGMSLRLSCRESMLVYFASRGPMCSIDSPLL